MKFKKCASSPDRKKNSVSGDETKLCFSGKKEAAAETKSTNQTTEDLNDLSNITNESTGDILNVESQAANDDDELAARVNQAWISIE